MSPHGLAGSSPQKQPHPQAFTLPELLVLLGVLTLLTLLVLPTLGGTRARTERAGCQSNLRQIGRAFTMWADDHSGRYPCAVPRAEGGLADYPLGNNLWFQFQLLSNELVTPLVLACPSDSVLRPAVDWGTSPAGFLHPSHQNGACSYFLALRDLPNPHGMLSGDRNINRTQDSMLCGLGREYNTSFLDIESSKLAWTETIHNRSGNIVFGDGSVQALNNDGLPAAVAKSLATDATKICVLFPSP